MKVEIQFALTINFGTLIEGQHWYLKGFRSNWSWLVLESPKDKGSIYEDTARCITNMPLSHLSQEDKVMWTHTKNGDYLVKSGYPFYRNCQIDDTRDMERKTWGCQTYWRTNLPPKCLLFWWKPLNKGLPQVNDLRTKGFKIQGLCPFGCDIVETAEHLFWECALTRVACLASNIGNRIAEPTKIPLKEFYGNLWQLAKTNTTLKEDTLPDFILKCNLHRNRVIFQGVSPGPHTELYTMFDKNSW